MEMVSEFDLTDWDQFNFGWAPAYDVDPDKQYKLRMYLRFVKPQYNREAIEGQDFWVFRYPLRLWWSCTPPVEGQEFDTCNARGDFYAVEQVDNPPERPCPMVIGYNVWTRLEEINAA